MSSTFTPVPVRARRDGWTPERQRAFIAALCETRCVAAARAVGRSFQTAYRLRARADAASFAAAWDAALAGPAIPIEYTSRAIDGVVTPITYRGRKVGERRRYDDRLAMFLLAIRSPERYGATVRVARPEQEDTAVALDAALAALRADPVTPAEAGATCGGPAPSAEPDFAPDAWPSSSPSAGRSRSTLRERPVPQRRPGEGGGDHAGRRRGQVGKRVLRFV